MMSDRHPDIYNEFDLEAARKAGQAYERERIIKLLEQVAIQQQKVLDFNNQRKDASGREIVIATTYQLLALIKGEQK
jgi:hypothetical protein